MAMAAEPERIRPVPVEEVRRDYVVDEVGGRAAPSMLNLTHDRVRWGPIVAGFFVAITALIMLGLLGLGVGLTGLNSGFSAAQGTPPPQTGTNAAIWGAISAIIAFLIGGYVAGRTSAVFSRGWGALNGALVFFLAIPVMLWLAGQGFGAVLGTLTQIGQVPGQISGSVTVTPNAIAGAAETARNGAWWALIAMVVGLIASAIGGAIGTREFVTVHHTTRVVD